VQIEDGEIFATINQKDGMVIFHDDPEKYNSPAMLRRLEEEVRHCGMYMASSSQNFLLSFADSLITVDAMKV
jgi:hypothetical protein